MTSSLDAVVVGAGPYGLSTAAHLLGQGLRVAVFGKPLGTWREHMPEGMVLRSHWWATNLSDPEKKHTFGRFLDRTGYGKGYPLPVNAFIDYGLWFQSRVVPNVDETFVTSIARRDGLFQVGLADGREVEAKAVVMATGLTQYANCPPEYSGPPGLVSHSSEHRDFRRFEGKRVILVGGGQSAVEFAALLHESGAHAELVSRRPIAWLDPDRIYERSLFESMLAPRAGIAPGWFYWVLDHAPYLFYRVPQQGKDRYNAGYFSGACDWLRDRVIGKVRLHEGRTIAALEPVDGRVAASLSDGTHIVADHVLLATGFRANVDRLSWLAPSLRADIRRERDIPVLNAWFESSVPGLYFVGFTSIRSFGPLYRFVAGAPAAARRVAHAVARGSTRRAASGVRAPAELGLQAGTVKSGSY